MPFLLSKTITKKIKFTLNFLTLMIVMSASFVAHATKFDKPNTYKIVKMQPINDETPEEPIFINTPDMSSKETNITLKDDYTAQDLKCLTQAIYFEAKSEAYEGGVAVGNVIMNRVKSPKFPNSICGVVHQKTGRMCQFSFICNGQVNQAINRTQWLNSEKIATKILNGTAPRLSNGALFFHAKYSKLRLASNRYTAKIGQHYFYK